MAIDLSGAYQGKLGTRCFECGRISHVMMLYNVPISIAAKQMKNIRCPFCGSTKMSFGEGRSLHEDRSMRKNGGSPEFRAGRWLGDGEIGQSALTIADFMVEKVKGSGLDLISQPVAPRDCDDLRRCMLLLDRIPEWNERMGEMSIVDGWKRLAPAWHDLAQLFLKESPHLRGSVPETGALLATLI